jgi:hypothetical protein
LLVEVEGKWIPYLEAKHLKLTCLEAVARLRAGTPWSQVHAWLHQETR